MNFLFYNIEELKEFILKRELNSHYSYLDKYYFIGKLDKKTKNQHDNIIEIDQIDKKIKFVKIKNFKYDFDIIEFYQKYSINDIKLKDRYNIFQFSPNKNPIKFKKDIQYNLNDLYHQENILKVTKRVIDDFDHDKYSSLNYKTKTLRTIKKYIENEFKVIVSQAFLKMYEILESFDLFDLKKKEFKTFHLCEAPGQFIKSIKYFLDLKDKKLDWHAQTLGDEKDGHIPFGDDYGLIRENRERWSFGDITDEKIIKSYREKCKGITLMTSDCGLRSRTLFEMTYQDKIMSYINFCQILAILYNLPKGGNFVAKVFLPQTVDYIVSLNYLLNSCFENFYVYKPYLNPSSGEIYLVGKNYHRLDAKTINKLFKMKDKLDITKGFLEIDNTFMKEYQKCFIEFIRENLKFVRRNIYFYLNHTKFDSEKLKEIQENNNRLWVKKFNFKKLTNKNKFYI